jgi:hypothetical protein
MEIPCNALKMSGNRLSSVSYGAAKCKGSMYRNKKPKNRYKNVDLTWMLRYKINSFEPLAQSVEHLTFNQVVVGSTPTRLTNLSEGLRLIAGTPRFFLFFGHIA